MMFNFMLIVTWIVVLAASVQHLRVEGRFYKANWRDPLEVKTSNGIVGGFLKKTCRLKTTFATFRGIPFAEPPLGSLRFKDPVAKANWEGVWDATFERPSCFQASLGPENLLGDYFSEDCLYLNIYTPNLKYLETQRGSLKAVMVFIHMGAFVAGSSDEAISSPDFLLEQDVIIVNLNYRLGPFGFLSFQNAQVPGNAGLKDQAMAMRWIKDNIQFFGGDPNKITLFGQSAGSASVNYHLLSKSSAGLFRNTIMQSGSVMATWAYSPPELALKKSLHLGRYVGCNSKNKDAVLECMQKVPAKNLNKLQQNTLTLEEILTFRGVAFNPTSEPNVPGAFITEPPIDMMFSGNFTKVPSIIGFTTDEGLLLYPLFMRNDPYGLLLTIVGMDLSRFIPYQFGLKPFSKISIEVHQAISRYYFGGKTPSKETITKVLELFTYSMFVIPVQLTADLLTEHSAPVYNYQFTYEGNYATYKISTNMTNVPGVCHGDDLGYVFYTPAIHRECGSKFSPPDELTISRMTKMWANFAKTGNPTPKTERDIPVRWQPYTSKESNYLIIGNDLVPSNSLDLVNLMFWNNLFKRIIDQLN